MSWSNEASVRVPGGRIAYTDVGEGRPVLLLHGFPMSSLLWRRDVPLLASRMRVIVADLLGFGASDAKGSADLSASTQAKCLGALLAVLGIDEVAVVGHGAGGAVALRMALDVEGPRVGCLVVMDAPAFEDRPLGGVGMAPELLGGAPGPGDVAAAMGRIIDRGVSRAGRVDEETRRAYLDPWVADPARFLRAGRAALAAGLSDGGEDLARLDIPVFLIWGEDDPFVPVETAERLQEHLAGSTLALLPGCSHFVTEEAPATVGPLVHEYLRSRYLAEGHAHAGASGPIPVFLERPRGEG